VSSWNSYTNNQGLQLLCLTNGKYLTWAKVPVGINLGFKDQGDNKTHFRLPDKQEREILSGEPVALGIGGKPAFLRYQRRDVGINLAYANNPHYQWRIFGADREIGKPIPENTPVALLNDKVQPEPDFLIHFDRPPGMADVGWTTSPGFWEQVGSLVEKHAIDAARIAIKALSE
jgi:hypothetical protein